MSFTLKVIDCSKITVDPTKFTDLVYNIGSPTLLQEWQASDFGVDSTCGSIDWQIANAGDQTPLDPTIFTEKLTDPFKLSIFTQDFAMAKSYDVKITASYVGNDPLVTQSVTFNVLLDNDCDISPILEAQPQIADKPLVYYYTGSEPALILEY